MALLTLYAYVAPMEIPLNVTGNNGNKVTASVYNVRNSYGYQNFATPLGQIYQLYQCVCSASVDQLVTNNLLHSIIYSSLIGEVYIVSYITAVVTA